MVAGNYRGTEATSTTDYNGWEAYTITSTGSCHIECEEIVVIDLSRVGWSERKVEIKPFRLRNCIQLRCVNFDGGGWA